MTDKNIICFSELDENGKKEAIEIFVAAFGYMFTFAQTDELVRLFTNSFNEEMIYVYMINNHVAGFLGLGTNIKAALKGDEQVCEEILGKWKGRMVYTQLFKKEEKPKVEKDSDLYIAYLATSVNVRKQGVGTKLLEFAFGMPGYTHCYLDVLSKNISAKKLYENLGFVAYKKKSHFFLFIQRLGHLIFMKRRND